MKSSSCGDMRTKNVDTCGYEVPWSIEATGNPHQARYIAETVLSQTALPRKMADVSNDQTHTRPGACLSLDCHLWTHRSRTDAHLLYCNLLAERLGTTARSDVRPASGAQASGDRLRPWLGNRTYHCWFGCGRRHHVARTGYELMISYFVRP